MLMLSSSGYWTLSFPLLEKTIIFSSDKVLDISINSCKYIRDIDKELTHYGSLDRTIKCPVVPVVDKWEIRLNNCFWLA